MKRIHAVLVFLFSAGGVAHADSRQALQAGAARIDITPPTSALRPGDSIRDPLFVRALLFRNGTSCAVLVGMDQGMPPGELMDSVSARTSRASSCPVANIVISATHTHSGSTHGIEPGGEPNAQRVADAVVEAVRQASTRIRPARIGFGTANVDLNINRDLFAANQWMQGPNPEGASDKTLAILEVLDTNDKPIGIYLNYAMHPIDFYLSGVVSADVPGEASRYIERRYGPDTVAIFVQGAAGDQNPRLTRPLYQLVAHRGGSPLVSDTRLTRPPPWIEMASERNANTRLSGALDAPVPADRRAAYEAAIQDQSELVTAMGALIGETTLDTLRYRMGVRTDQATIGAATASFQCPGRDRQDAANPVREGALPPYADGEAVTFKEGVLRLGDIYIVSINAEVYSQIGMHLKQVAPTSRLMLTTLANGIANSGYVYSNAAGSHLTFQVIGSRLKPGCAEDKIVSTALELISKVQNP